MGKKAEKSRESTYVYEHNLKSRFCEYELYICKLSKQYSYPEFPFGLVNDFVYLDYIVIYDLSNYEYLEHWLLENTLQQSMCSIKNGQGCLGLSQ